MQLRDAGSANASSPGRMKRMLSQAAEKIGFPGRKDKDQEPHSKASAGKLTKSGQTKSPPPAQDSSSSDSSDSRYHDAQTDISMEDVNESRRIPGSGKHATGTRSEGGAKSRGGSHRPGVSVADCLERIQQLESDIRKERATTAESGRVIQGLMETVESQKIAIETIGGERDRLFAEKKDLEGTWSLQKAELEKLVRRQGVAIDKRNAEIQDLKTENKEESNRRKESGIRIQALDKAWREAREEADRERMQLNALKREFAAMQRHVDTTTKLLETRTEELTAAQAFLTTADECSGADFARMVAQLNDDIYHCVVLMAEAVIEPEAVEENLDKGAMEKIVEHLSGFGWTEAQIRRLQSDILEQDTILFEAMAQYIFVRWCDHVVSSFCYDSKEVDRYFQELWNGIATSADAIIAKNWLSMTHSQLKKNRIDEAQVMKSLGNVMFAVGWRATTPKKNDFAQRVAEKVGEICAKALKIKEMATQKILSADVRLFQYAPGTPYNPAKMEDAYDSGKEAEKANPGEPLLCSTGLGVRHAVVHSQSSGRESRWNVILKSKVVLASTVEIQQQSDQIDSEPREITSLRREDLND